MSKDELAQLGDPKYWEYVEVVASRTQTRDPHECATCPYGSSDPMVQIAREMFDPTPRPMRPTTGLEKLALGYLGVFAAVGVWGVATLSGAAVYVGTGARLLALRLSLAAAPIVGATQRVTQSLNDAYQAVEEQVLRLTYGQGFERGIAAARNGLETVLGKYPGNVEYVNRTVGTVTVDTPGWTAMYNAGFVRGVLEGGGAIRFTSEAFTGTFALEAQQVLGIPGAPWNGLQ